MPLQTLLKDFAMKLVSQCPIQVIDELSPGSNQYLYVESNFEISYGDPFSFEQNLPPPNEVQTRSLTPISIVLLNGGTVKALDHDYLSKIEDEALSRTSAAIGSSCIQLSKIKKVDFEDFVDVAQIDNAIQELQFGNDPDATVLSDISTFHRISSKHLHGRIRHHQTGRLHTSRFIDYGTPIYSPGGFTSNNLIVFDWYNSFVLAAPEFIVKDNKLIFNFKLDISDLKTLRAFNVP